MKMMQVRLRHVWQILRTGYWFIPCVMIVIAGVGAELLLFLDRHLAEVGWVPDWFYGGGPEGAKTLLSTIASSVVTVAGVVFSITIAALTQASSQFGPRLLRNFMSDRGNQSVLGVFVATFIFCLLVLRTIHQGGTDANPRSAFVPQASITVAVLLALTSTLVLIYFIHHVSMSLQSPQIVAAVRHDLGRSIQRLPQPAQPADGVRHSDSDADADATTLPDFDGQGQAVLSNFEGYLQAVDYDALVQLARVADSIFHVSFRPGDYVVRGATLVCIWPYRPLDAQTERRVMAAFIYGNDGTPEQDIEYAIRQIVEVAVRALSPGTNDPFTAINCLDALSGAVCQIADCQLPGRFRDDAEHNLRLVVPVTTFQGVLDVAFNQIRQSADRSVAVMIHLLEVLRRCARQLPSAHHRLGLLRHAEMVHLQCERTIVDETDRRDARERWHDLKPYFPAPSAD